MKKKKALLKAIVDVTETAYRRGFTQGAYFANEDVDMRKLLKWRYASKRKSNSPISRNFGYSTLESCVMYYADKPIKDLYDEVYKNV